jgi:hypothetical protein
MYIGRGDVCIRDLPRQYERVRARFQTPQEAVNQMAEKTPQPAYLEEGLRLLVKNRVDVDELLAQGDCFPQKAAQDTFAPPTTDLLFSSRISE